MGSQRSKQNAMLTHSVALSDAQNKSLFGTIAKQFLKNALFFGNSS